MRGSPLARFLFAAYFLLTVYASLYPFAGWHGAAAPVLALLVAPWPRFITAFDIAANFVGYVSYGFLCVLALHPRVRGAWALAATIGSGAVLSIALEAAQGFLPTRIPSSLDVLANVSGATAGAFAGLRMARWLLDEGPLLRLREAWFAPGPGTGLGLTLLGLWLFAQLNPATLAFGTGDLRDLVAAPAGQAHGAEFFVAIEAATGAANLLAVALLVSAMANPGVAVRRLLLVVVVATLAVKALAFSILMRAESVFAWLTPGAQAGIVIGSLAMLAGVALGRTLRLALAAVLIMAATVLVNLAPPNPYLAATLKVWSQGHFLNFNGLTRLVSAAWPFAALGYLIYLASRRSRDASGG